jgi:hypothetical protein
LWLIVDPADGFQYQILKPTIHASYSNDNSNSTITYEE